MADCETRLKEAQSALHDLITGQQVVSVSAEGESISYAQADRRNLEAYVAQLADQCGDVNNLVPSRRGPARVVF